MKISKYDEGQWMLHLSSDEADRLYAALTVSPSPFRNEAMEAISNYFDMGYEPLPDDGSEVPVKTSEKKYQTLYVNPDIYNINPVHASASAYVASLKLVIANKSLMEKIFGGINGSAYGGGIGAIKEIRTFLKEAGEDYGLYIAKSIYDAIKTNHKTKGWGAFDVNTVKFSLDLDS